MSEPVLSPEDDIFWLQRAGAIVSGTVEQLDRGARRLADAMAWFWTAYSAVVLAILVGTNTALGLGPTLALTLPAILLFAAYVSATYASLPVDVQFDDRVPEDIKAAHDLAVRVRRGRIRASTAVATVAALSVAAAVPIAAMARAGPTSPLAAVAFNPDGSRLLVGGRIADANHAVVRVVAPNGSEVERLVPMVENVYDSSFEVSHAGVYEVSVNWVVSGTRFTLAQEVEKP